MLYPQFSGADAVFTAQQAGRPDFQSNQVLFSGRQSSQETEVEIDPRQLCEGLFVRLPHGWMNHPFLFNQFRISSAEQIATLRDLGLPKLLIVPERSTAKPLPLSSDAPAPPPQPSGPSEDQIRAAEAKRRRSERIAVQRERLSRCEKKYEQAASQVRDVMRNLFASSERSVVSARDLVGGIVDSFAEDSDVVIHLMGEKLADENAYFHSLNVMILSLLLGRDAGLPAEELRVLGEGALFHDIGKSRVPDAVQRNPQRNRHEEEFFRLHTVYGTEIAAEMGLLHPEAIRVIGEHHETIDGKGYPNGLTADRLSRVVRIVGLVNRYDNLCNPLQSDQASTPAEALSRLFKREQEQWDKQLLQRFVRILGVYPPGSIVQLSNGNTGIVVSVDRANLLRPSVLIYDPDVPKSEAIIVDLADEPEVAVECVVRPADLSPAALRYLSPRRRLSYFHSHKAQESGRKG